MASKRRHSLSRTIMSLFIGVPAVFSIVGRIFTLIGIETKVAAKSLVAVIALTLIATILLGSIWLCLVLMLYVYLISLQWAIQSALCLILGIHIILLIIVLLIIASQKKKLRFPETRDTLHQAMGIYRDL